MKSKMDQRSDSDLDRRAGQRDAASAGSTTLTRTGLLGARVLDAWPVDDHPMQRVPASQADARASRSS